MSKQTIKMTFPKAEAVFPALSRPDTKFDELGQYKADFRLSESDAAPVIAKLQKIVKEHTGKAYPKKKNAMWYYEVDPETGEETGFVIFKVRVKNKLRKSDGKLWDRKPLLIDAKKKDLPTAVNPWGGSVIRVQAEVYCYTQPQKGVTLQPLVVQVIELVSGGSKADTSDFDEEDGYEAPENDTSDFDDEDEGGSTDEDDDGDVDY